MVLAAALAGCGAYTAGESFREVADEGYMNQDSPEAAVQKWLRSMEWKINPETGARDPELGRNFQAYYEVSSPVLFPEDLVPDEGDWNDLQDEWSSRDWEIEFLDLQFETTSNDGADAVIKLVGGQTRYIGKVMFGTTEYKVDDFQDKQGEIYLKKIQRNEKNVWVIVGAKMLSDDQGWTVQ